LLLESAQQTEEVFQRLFDRPPVPRRVLVHGDGTGMCDEEGRLERDMRREARA
jgi:hypothetical protein